MATQYTSIHVSHAFSQPAQRVFDAWLDPEVAVQWLFATPDGEMLPPRIDALVGGRFSITERRDGEDWEHCGEYLEIDAPRKLAFSFYLPKFIEQFGSSIVRIQITDGKDGSCELSLTQEHCPVEFAEQSTAGWKTLLANLEQTLASQGSSAS